MGKAAAEVLAIAARLAAGRAAAHPQMGERRSRQVRSAHLRAVRHLRKIAAELEDGAAVAEGTGNGEGGGGSAGHRGAVGGRESSGASANGGATVAPGALGASASSPASSAVGAAAGGVLGVSTVPSAPAAPVYPSDPSFLSAREERLAARNGASLRKKPNFQELAQAFENELAQDAAREKKTHGPECNRGNAASSADLENTVPWDEDEDLGPDEYFETGGEGDSDLAAPLLTIIGAAAEAQRGIPEGHCSSAETASAEGATTTGIGTGTAVMPCSDAAATPAGAAPGAVRAPANPDGANGGVNDDADDQEDGTAFDRIPAIAEARLIASLNDPNIVTVYDCQESNGRAYIIMEFVDGLTLADFLEKVGDQITLDMIAAIVAAVTGALEAAHSHNVLHLDIKPENVLIDRQGKVKVTDFGLATLADASGHGRAAAGTIGYMPPEQLRLQPLDVRTDEWAVASLTYEMLTGSNQFIVDDLEAAGTIGYMPPEQLRLQPLDVRTDEWAVASLTYEMLTGSNQFIVDDLEAALPAIEDSELPVPSQMWDEAGDALDDVVFTGLDIDPEDRYQTVEEFAQAILPQLGSARKGKKQLAAALNQEDEPEAPEIPPEPQGPVIPLVDRVGPRGAQLLVRILCALSCGGCAALAMMNFHALGVTSMGLATDAPFVFWPLLVAAVALAAVRPTFGALAAPLFLAISFFANEAFLLALGFGALTVVWWVKFCKDDEPMALCALLGPATGAFGMGATAPLLAGALLSVGRAAICAIYNALFALVMACLGSCTLLGWNIAANSHFTINMQLVFLNVVQRPETWVMAVAWVGAAVAFSLFCARGTRIFDVLGSLAGAAVLLLAGWACAQLATGFDPLSIAGCILPGAFAAVLALLGVPDRARRDPDDWEQLRHLDDIA